MWNNFILIDTNFNPVFKVKLLKDTLDAWKKEVEKKPPTMSIDDAYEVLNLPQGQGPWVIFSIIFPLPLAVDVIRGEEIW